MPGPIALCLSRYVARRGRVAAVLAALLLPLAGPAPAEVLRVGAASSLREATDALARDFEARHGVRVAVSYGASSVLAAQLRAGAPLDVLLSADAALAAGLAREGVVGAIRPFARNRLVVLARAGVPAFEDADDLADASLRRIAVPHAAVPIGRYARSWLEARGLLEPLRPRLVTTEHARATLLAVDAGHVDAAVVYATDAALARRAHVAWRIPADEQPEILYASAVARAARDPVQASAFIDLLVDDPGREHLAKAGFVPVPSL